MTAEFSVTCEGCRKRVAKTYSGNMELNKKMRELSSEGWLRREFGPHAEPWFCSLDCAYHSDAALEIEKHWEKGGVPRWVLALLFFIPCAVLIYLFWRL